VTWKKATCETCTYRVGDECRRFPQFKTVVQGYEYVTGPFQVVPDFEITGYERACAEHATILPIMPELNIKEAVR